MKALVCTALGSLDSLEVKDVPEPTIGAGEVLVRVAACGINYPDVLLVMGKYQIKPEPPFSPGGEISGVVEAVGPGVTRVKPGDRVAGMLAFGGLAEKVALPEAAVFRVPEGADLDVAAGVLVTYGTALHALRDRAAMKPGETLLVLGAAGGVGVAAIQVGKVLGAKVIAAASSPEKLEVCRASGADLVLDYAKEDLKARVKELTRGDGVDVVFDAVGGGYTEAALRATGWGGRVLIIGFVAGDIPKVPTNLVLLKGSSIVGVFWGSFVAREPERGRTELEEILGWLAAGTIRPHVHGSVPLARGAEAIRELAERRVRGKMLVKLSVVE